MPRLPILFRSLAALVGAALVAACGGARAPHAVLLIEDPDHMAEAADRLGIGSAEGDELTEVDLQDRSLDDGVTVTLTSGDAGERLLLIEARAEEDPLARAWVRVRFVTDGANATPVRLGAPCDVSEHGSVCSMAGGDGEVGVCVFGACAVPVCGDGVVDPATEECDDGNAADADDCRADCLPNVCGDGVRNPGAEVCDDGNTEGGDGCRADCDGFELCGDGFIDFAAGEVCDDGNQAAGDGCRADCRGLEDCGDGLVDEGEVCDDGNNAGANGCRSDCSGSETCGDGLVDEGEACDDGNLDDEDDCRSDCTEAVCGDGVWSALSEGCDDGNDIDTDGCRNDCTEAVCGDGVVFVGVEACDEGADNDSATPDACRADCTLPYCGDGVADTGEACDNGVNNSDTDPAACRKDCALFSCGDGVLDPGEGCDDGAANSDTAPDACRTDCTPARCGDRVVDALEGCDDGNVVDDDHCRTDCTPAACGDGVVDTAAGSREQCDDANDNPNDGCADCTTTTWAAGPALAGGGGGAGVDGTELAMNPDGLALDPYGTLYVADGANHRVLRLEVDGSLTRVAGNGLQGDSGDGGPATSARLNHPAQIAVDGFGRITIVDRCNNQVRQVDETGVIRTVHEFTGALGGCATSPWKGPRGLSAASGDDLYVVHQSEHRLYHLTRANIDGPWTAAVAFGDDETNQLLYPTDVVVTQVAPTLVFVSDYGPTGDGRVLQIDGDGTSEVALLRDSIANDEPPSFFSALRMQGDDVVAVDQERGEVIRLDVGALPATETPVATGLASPIDAVPVTGNQLFVAEADTHTVVLATGLGQTAQIVAGSGVPLDIIGAGGAATALTADAAAIAAGDGVYYVADPARNLVWRVKDGNYTVGEVFAGSGEAGNLLLGVHVPGDPVPATMQQLRAPAGVAVGPGGEVYIADTDNHCVRRVLPGGALAGVFGTCGAYGAPLRRPTGLAARADGTLYVADTGSDEVLEVTWGVGAPTYAPILSAPDVTDLIVDEDAKALYVSDRNSGNNSQRVRRVSLEDLSEEELTSFACPSETRTICSGGDGKIDIFEDFADLDGKAVDVQPIPGGQSCTTTTTSHCDRVSIALGPEGELVLTRYDEHTVEVVTEQGRAAAVGIPGAPGAGGDGLAPGAAHLNAPMAAAVAPDGRILIGDVGNGRVRAVNLTDDTPRVVTELGPVHALGDGPLGPGAHVGSPAAVLAQPIQTPTSRLWVFSDPANGRVRAIDRAGSMLTTVIGYEGAAPPSQWPAAAAFSPLLRSAGGVAFDPASGSLFVVDRGDKLLYRVGVGSPAGDVEGWRIRPIAGADAVGCPAEPAEVDATSVCLSGATSLAWDEARSSLYLADTTRHIIRALDFEGGGAGAIIAVRTLVGTALQPGDILPAQIDDVLDPAAVRLNGPAGVALGKDGALLLSDTGNHHVFRLAADEDGALSSHGELTVVLGDGSPANAGLGAPARLMAVKSPRGLAIDTAGNLFVAAADGVRRVTADALGRVTGEGDAGTVFSPMDPGYDGSACLSALFVDDDTVGSGAQDLVVALDACSGRAVQVRRIEQAD